MNNWHESQLNNERILFMINKAKTKTTDTTNINPVAFYDDSIKRDIDVMRKRHYSLKEKNRRTYKNTLRYRNHLKDLSKTGWYPSGAYEVETGKQDDSTYVRRYWKSQGKDSSYAIHKRTANRYVRRKFNNMLKNYNFRNLCIDKSEDDFYLYEDRYGEEIYAPQNNDYRDFYDLWRMCF